ncbi:MAG: RNA-binding protein [Candidatus Diapherotrites archaeon]|nr:RNA-binding protein [Candidatus Diapherotrites archaeon]MDZ4256059.1 RNA-binding protein [archaeon]
MSSMKICSSCNTQVMGNYIEFRCPVHEKEKIVRCQRCRETVRSFACKEGEFVGP